MESQDTDFKKTESNPTNEKEVPKAESGIAQVKEKNNDNNKLDDSRKYGFYVKKKDYEDYLKYNGGNIDRKDESEIVNKFDDYIFSDKKKIICRKGTYVSGFENYNYLRLYGLYYLVEKNGNKITKLVDGAFKFISTTVTFENKSFQGDGYIPLSNIDYLLKTTKIILR